MANGFELKNTEEYNIQDDLQDRFLYIAKNKPELYFNENIRSGISAFAALDNKDEIRSGLSKLQADLQNDTFRSVKDQCKNSIGDYLFITVKIYVNNDILMPYNQNLRVKLKCFSSFKDYLNLDKEWRF